MQFVSSRKTALIIWTCIFCCSTITPTESESIKQAITKHLSPARCKWIKQNVSTKYSLPKNLVKQMVDDIEKGENGNDGKIQELEDRLQTKNKVMAPWKNNCNTCLMYSFPLKKKCSGKIINILTFDKKKLERIVENLGIDNSLRKNFVKCALLSNGKMNVCEMHIKVCLYWENCLKIVTCFAPNCENKGTQALEALRLVILDKHENHWIPVKGKFCWQCLCDFRETPNESACVPISYHDSLNDILQRPYRSSEVPQPLNEDEENLAYRLIRRKYHTDSKDGVMQFKEPGTGGRPLSVRYQSKGESENPSERTILRHAQSSYKYRKVSAGGLRDGGFNTSHIEEKIVIKEMRKMKIIKKFSINGKEELTPEKYEWLITELGLTEGGCLVLNRMLRESGVGVPNASKVYREYMNRDNFSLDFGIIEVIEKDKNHSKKDKVFKYPYAIVSNPDEPIGEILNERAANRTLRWPMGTPKNKAVLQVGIDHGKKHLTLIGQLMHQKNTHARNNCITLGLIEGSKDDPNVLEEVTSKLFEHINKDCKVTVKFPPVTTEESQYPACTPFDTDVAFVEFPCSYCNRYFDNLPSLNYHIRDSHIAHKTRQMFNNMDHDQDIDFPIYVCSNSKCTFSCKTPETLEKHQKQHWSYNITAASVEKPYSHGIGKVTRVQLKGAKENWIEYFNKENIDEEESTDE